MTRQLAGASPVPQPTLQDRLERRASRWGVRVRGRNPALLALRVVRRASDVRLPGLAAEMAFYLVLSVIPLVTAVGAGLGLLRYWLDDASVEAMEAALTDAVEAVLSPELASDVAVPLVRELLRQEQVGVALTGVAGALWLGSRVFRAAVRTLGDAYRVEERRSLPAVWGLSLLFTAAAVVVITVLLSLVVVGPLLGGGQQLADALGAGAAFQVVWSYGRWPAVLLVCTAYLAWLYHAGHSAAASWRGALPGAVLATGALVLLMAGFRVYVDVAGPAGPDVGDASAALAVVGRFIGTALAAMLLAWLASGAVLLGGVFNAEWHEEAAGPPEPGS